MRVQKRGHCYALVKGPDSSWSSQGFTRFKAPAEYGRLVPDNARYGTLDAASAL